MEDCIDLSCTIDLTPLPHHDGDHVVPSRRCIMVHQQCPTRSPRINGADSCAPTIYIAMVPGDPFAKVDPGGEQDVTL